MNPEEPMTVEERHQYLRRMKKRYQKATRQERSRLLDEMEAYTGLHRKSLIRLLGTDLERHPRGQERRTRLFDGSENREYHEAYKGMR